MNPKDHTILVTGATGRQGGAAARHLLDRGFNVRALTRNPDKPDAKALAERGAQVIEGDMDRPDTLAQPLAGAHGVFSVQDFWTAGPDSEVRQATNLADAAKRAGVRHFVYSSVGSAHRDTGIPHFETKWRVEQHLSNIDIPRTILRPVFFMENWEMDQLRSALLDGTLPQPLDPDRPLQQIATDDIGAFAAMAFESPDHWIGREIELAGDELTMPRVAETFTAVIGRPVKHQQVPWDQFEQQAGPEMTVMYKWFNDTGYEADIPALRELHPALATLEQYLRETGWVGAAA